MARAALLLILGTALIPLGDTAAKIMGEDHGVSPFFIAWSRFALGALIVLPFLGRRHIAPRYLADWRLWLRAALILAGVTSITTALRTEPIANVFGAFFVGPIFSVALSAILLGERVTAQRLVLLLVGFAGVLLVVRPGFGMTPGLGFAVLAGMFYGGYLTASRWLADAAPPRTLLFTQLLGGAILAAPAGLALLPEFTPEVSALIALSAVASASGNLLLILAYRRAPATRLAPFIYFQLVAATIYGRVVFGDLPDALTFTGLALLILSGFASLALKR